jgi:putative glutathione S-transferase
MSQMIDGVWTTEMPTATPTSGRFARARTVFHGIISADGLSGHKTKAGCYHLYAAHACPRTHRTMMVRKLKRLEAAISVSVVDPIMGEGGGHFGDQRGGIPDSVHGPLYLRDVYVKACSGHTGRVTVPVLWDRAEHTIVNNASADVIRMFRSFACSTRRSRVSAMTA